MSNKSRRQLFGVYGVTGRDTETGKYLGNARVLGQASVNSSGENVQNTGGASPHAYASEDGLITTEISLTLKEYPNWLIAALTGGVLVTNAAEPDGAVATALDNYYGVSVLDATTGLASVTLKSGGADDLKGSKYTIVAASETTVNVYAASDIDFARGTSVDYIDDELKINAIPLSIATGAATEISGFGLEINGGSGTIAMVAGDTATFEVRAPNTGSTKVVVGAPTDKIPQIGLEIFAQERANGELCTIEIFSCKGGGLPISLSAKEWAEAEITLAASLSDKSGELYEISLIDKVKA